MRSNDISPDVSTSERNDDVRLKKLVGLNGGISLIVGTMIGSGIFVSPSGVALRSGSAAMSIVYWTICGIISTMGALCLAELGTLIPESGGEYVYLNVAFGELAAYMFSWMSVLLLKPASCSIMSLTCAEYIIIPVINVSCTQPSPAVVKIVAVLIVLFLTSVNCFSVKLANQIQILFTITKLGAMFVIIIGGIVNITRGETGYLISGFQGTKTGTGHMALALYSGMWAYDGWNNLNYVTEELINPYVNLPRSIVIAIPMVTVVYVLVNTSYYTVMSLNDVINSPAVAVTFAARTWGTRFMWIEQVLVATSTFGALNGELFGASRLTFVAARQGHMLKVFSYLHIQRYTPVPALIVTCMLTLCFIIPGDISSLIDVFNFAVWLFYGLTMLSLIVLRQKMKTAYRPYKVSLFVPYFVILVSIFLVLAPVIAHPQIEFLYAAMFIFSGLVVYFVTVYYKKQLPGVEYLSTLVQLLLQVTPITGDITQFNDVTP